MYKYGQQEQVTVRNRNRSTALERSVLKYWGAFLSPTYELVSEFNVGLKTLLQQGLLEPEFYGD